MTFVWSCHRRAHEHARRPSLHERGECAAGLEHAVGLLHEEFDDQLGANRVDGVIVQATARFTGATVLTFVPLLVRRYAREELLTHLDIKKRQATHLAEAAVVGESVQRVGRGTSQHVPAC